MAKKVVFDSKQKQILAGLMPITPGAEIEFTPEAYRQRDEKGNYLIDPDLWPVWTLRVTDGLKAASEEDKIDFDPETQKISMAMGASRIRTLKRGIVRVDNWLNQEGKLIKVERDHAKKGSPISDRFIAMIPAALQVELVNAMEHGLDLTTEEETGLKS